MKNIATYACFLLVVFICQEASAQVYRQVCENGTCQLVEVAPVRKAVSAVADVVSDVPPVPVMHSVMEHVTATTTNVTHSVVSTAKKPVSRVLCSVKKVVNRVRIFKR